jgi:uncharacterized protein YcfJ
MKRTLSLFTSLAIAAAAVVPMSAVIATDASAKMSPQAYCDMVATKYANHKTDKKVFTNMLVAGTVGGLIGHALPGGKSSTAIGIGLGAGAGMIHGSSKWNKYYNNKFNQCMDNY